MVMVMTTSESNHLICIHRPAPRTNSDAEHAEQEDVATNLGNWDNVETDTTGDGAYNLSDDCAHARTRSRRGMVEPARELAYRLSTVCERKKWAPEALGYNSLVVS